MLDIRELDLGALERIIESDKQQGRLPSGVFARLGDDAVPPATLNWYNFEEYSVVL